MLNPAAETAIDESSFKMLVDKAARLAIEKGKITLAGMQRHLAVNYNKAAEIMDTLATLGIIGPVDLTGKRAVLVTLEHYERAVFTVENFDNLKKVAEAQGSDFLSGDSALAKIAAAKVACNEELQKSDAPADSIDKPEKMRPAAKVTTFRGQQDETSNDVGGISGQRLKSFIDRIERMEEEKAGLGEDLKDIYAELKGTGFDTKTVRKLIRLRKMDKQKRMEEEEMLELYKSAIGLE